jgi:putative addiction module CopG family antidote
LAATKEHPVNVSLTPQLEEIVRKKVESGMYGSASEAIRLMDHQDRLNRLRADIAKADAEFERGEYFVESPGFWASVQEEAERMEREDIEPDPKVRP